MRSGPVPQFDGEGKSLLGKHRSTVIQNLSQFELPVLIVADRQETILWRNSTGGTRTLELSRDPKVWS